MGRLIAVTSLDGLEEAFGQKRAIIYKHSTRCPISAMAREQVVAYTKEHDEGTAVYEIDVIRYRDISDTVTKRTGITHQSPQIIVITEGEPPRAYSHWDITRRLLERIGSDEPSPGASS